jgi:hypothetical protein
MKLLVKLVVALVVIAGFVWMFLRTAREARSEPYAISAQQLRGWTVAVEPASGPASPLLVLRPPQELSSSVFQQIFSRNMESLRGSTGTGVPLVLRGEYELSLASTHTVDALAEAARGSGLEDEPFTPECVALKRISEPGNTRQLYYLRFGAPAFQRFRDRLASETQSTPGIVPFDAGALAPILIVAATDAAFDSWLPIGRESQAECIAPLEAR